VWAGKRHRSGQPSGPWPGSSVQSEVRQKKLVPLGGRFFLYAFPEELVQKDMVLDTLRSCPLPGRSLDREEPEWGGGSRVGRPLVRHHWLAIETAEKPSA